MAPSSDLHEHVRPGGTLPHATWMGQAELTVTDLDRSVAFYENASGCSGRTLRAPR